MAFESLEKLEENIGYKFKDISLLKLAVTHSSYVHERVMNKIQCNERIEFLGDAVLEAVSSEFLYNTYPDKQEGELTKLRASLVCESALAVCAKEIKLPQFLVLGVGEDKGGGRYRDSVTSDAFEAVIGAIFIDGGFDEAKTFIKRYVLNDIEHKTLFHDSKSILQEYSQANFKKPVTYEILTESGPEHDKTFVAQVVIGDFIGCKGQGHSKKAAEQNAAYETLLHLKNTNEGK
ncbi:MAG: ribonuclease III [Lachnospiraceae bacterium]|nr:ribonuclease III [Lachnospiraceae bacterium]